ncbi:MULTISPECIES: phytoene desaturase family protein [Caproicibacterium]|uniref:FAD-dependent oxidoreductase n=1 Tax=Caproicibacterium argilliputei TaxID=3030016 RepID=A0AA97H3U0_9FIRM|nr:FAD-dependent oxidoreductase [Caproicibacterium argilliputei]WOC32673.1 FAD-dependent oxidoreductase [Caproicibacterium argilliputei]
MGGPKRIAIIGAGVAGLSAGIYAQLHGFRTTIYEKNGVAGGACMSWLQGNLPMEGSMRYLWGVRDGTPLYDCWNEVGALRETMFVNPDSFFTAEDSGETVALCQDLDTFLRHTEKISPEDAPLLERFCGLVRKAQAYELPVDKPADLRSPLEALRANTASGEVAKVLAKLYTVSLADFAQQFHHPALRCAFNQVLPAGSTLGQLALCYAAFTAGDVAVPIGGSHKMIQRMVDCYLENDGELQLQAPVQEILTANGAARGVRLQNGERLLTHWVVSACDPAYTCRVLLQDRYSMEKKLQLRFSEPEAFPTFSLVRLFFSAPADSLPLARVFSFATDLVISAAGEGCSRLIVTQLSDDPLFVQKGCAELIVDIPMPGKRSFRYWEKLSVSPRAYDEEVHRLAADAERALEKRFPDMKGKLQFLTCHTPMTYARRLNAFHGSCAAFLETAKARPAQLTGRLPGLSHLLLTGQWLGRSAGLHTALVQGKYTVQRICHEERILWD